MNAPKHEAAPRRAFAIVRDPSRRAGFRVARVHVLLVLEMGGAEVEEITLRRTSHWLPFAQLSTRGARDIGAKLRGLLSREASKQASGGSDAGQLPGPDDKQTPGPISERDRGNAYVAEPEFIASDAEGFPAAAAEVAQGAGATLSP